ncbi:hypothetical protein CN507_22695 [Bacillus cereus]|uniref:Beta-lactamase inhibitor (BLIP) n=1 Tax=Bacillus nitratireducens TaxID=2026193 RepID=A0ABU6PLZ9_9BACI|nr:MULTISPECIES: hypothetical protein [Bacillus cereus group]EJS60123.1 hypothetical protein ICG_00985 [Bacillus cereus BAG1X1-3]EOO71586.1 hypothetical protein IC7_03869 [Bacillus cereus BAG1O-1]OSX98218.1 hypothetical protein BTJ45_05111 [Bacillus mycoides]MBE7120752.1 hypothetical protein [Bacillus cereus]MDR4171373.1 hypothetical protein [Bacillus nitratireducens]
MTKTKKRNIIILTILILLITCTAYIIHNRNTTKERAAEVAIKHMKTEENIDVTVTKVEIQHMMREGFIDIKGHTKNDKNRKFHVTINKTQNYSVMGWGLDDPK